MIPVPFLIGAAVAGGVAYALSDDKKHDGQWIEEKTTRLIPESELPSFAKEKLRRGEYLKDAVEDLGEDLGEESMRRVLSESQLPAYAKHKLEEKRKRSGGTAAAKSEFVCSNSFDQDFSRIDNMLSQDEHFDIIREALQKIAKRADTHCNAEAMNKVAFYYQEIYAFDAAQRCFDRAKILARS